MSVLKSVMRPTVAFDVKKPEHRQYFANFLKNRTWKDCPVRFNLEESYMDVPSLIQDRINKHYFEADKQITF